jgi:hypothetical protein
VEQYQTGSKITIEINRRKLTPESYGHGRTPGQRVIKGPAKRKKIRRRQTKQRNTSNETPDILFLLDVCNNRGNLSYRNDELVSF